jgi:hypothetical protein
MNLLNEPKPYCFRLPKNGETDIWFGCTRTFWATAIRANGHPPAVRGNSWRATTAISKQFPRVRACLCRQSRRHPGRPRGPSKMPRRLNPQNLVLDWNLKFEIGQPVDVTLDDGNVMESKTESEAWVLGGHSAVIKLEGISGGYSLTRVRARTTA